jgi:hypothetical protein
MKQAVHGILLLLLAGFSVWLFTVDEAAKPGPLRAAHQEKAECRDCHVPWRGVSHEQCLGCHFFADPLQLSPAKRFHLAHEHCLSCHTEHHGRVAELTSMDHTILHPDLLCSQCHRDPHGGLFGQECRACHSITTWRVEGFHHPSAEGRDCHRCHPLPLSHQDEEFWRVLLEKHRVPVKDPAHIRPQECWRCHQIHNWRLR